MREYQVEMYLCANKEMAIRYMIKKICHNQIRFLDMKISF